MQDDTTKTHDSDTSNSIPIHDLDDLSTNDAIAVHATKDDSQTILVGTITDIPEQPVKTIIKQQDNPCNATTVTTSVVSINASTWWHINDDGIHDYSTRLNDRPPIKRHYRDRLSDPPSISLAATNHRQVHLIIPIPNGSGEYVKDYYPANYGAVTEIQTGALVSAANLLPDNHNPPI